MGLPGTVGAPVIRRILLRLSMTAFGVIAMAAGGIAALFPRAIADLTDLADANIVVIGFMGALLAFLGLGAFLASRNPIRHLLWLRLIILYLLGVLVFLLLQYWSGAISQTMLIAGAAFCGVFAFLYIILFPRSPRLVSTRVRTPDGLLYTDPDEGGLFVRRATGLFSPYIIRLSRPPVVEAEVPEQAAGADEQSQLPSRIMVVGSGAREHAIAIQLNASPHLEKLWVAPGNGGTEFIAENLPIPVNEVSRLVQAAKDREVDLVVIGPEEPLALGLADALNQAGIMCLGPSRAAARLESSKTFAKEVMAVAGVQTAAWARFTDYVVASEYIRLHGLPLVIKADGLTGGKGVAVCHTEAQALSFLHHVMRMGDFGEAGQAVIIEEALEGVELSAFAFCNGEQILPMAPACDYKRIYDDDAGPNTGGMGSYSPPEFADAEMLDRIRSDVFEPVLRRMAEIGSPYTGILYAGLMLTKDGLRVLEFNCRMGDPEAQVVLPRITSDFLALAYATAAGALDQAELTWTDNPGVGVVLASEGYPGSYPLGLEITGLDQLDPDVFAFHAGTKIDHATGQLVTAGGRVLTIAAMGETMADAREKAYANAERVTFGGVHYRRDIARRAVAQKSD